MTTLAARFPPTPFATTARSPLSLCGMLGLSFNYVVLQSLTTDPFLCSTGIRTRPSKLFHVCVGVLSLVSSGVAVSQRSQQISCVVFRARSCRSPRRASRHRPPGQLERSLHVFTTVTRSLCYWRAVFGSTCRTLHIKLSTRGPLHG